MARNADAIVGIKIGHTSQKIQCESTEQKVGDVRSRFKMIRTIAEQGGSCLGSNAPWPSPCNFDYQIGNWWDNTQPRRARLKAVSALPERILISTLWNTAQLFRYAQYNDRAYRCVPTRNCARDHADCAINCNTVCFSCTSKTAYAESS